MKTEKRKEGKKERNKERGEIMEFMKEQKNK